MTCKGALISVTIGKRGRLQVKLISYTTVIATVDLARLTVSAKLNIVQRAYENKTAS